MTDLATNKATPVPSAASKKIPSESKKKKAVPAPTDLDKDLPSTEKEENCIVLGDRKVEIKATKLKYFRNRTASIYSALKLVPLNEFLAYDKGVFDKERDSDQILFDFLIAVFDDGNLVKTYYDDMTSDDIEKILQIFGRVNHIDEKEEAARKNREAQATR